jgi:arginyl-tRNA synthetase
MSLQEILSPSIKTAIYDLFEVSIEKIEFQATRKDFEGDITVVIFPLLKVIKGNPVEIGTKIGKYLTENLQEVEKFNVVAGFLNIVISDASQIKHMDFVLELKMTRQSWLNILHQTLINLYT